MATRKKSNGEEKTSRVTEDRIPVRKHLRCELGALEIAERADRAAHLLSRRDSLEADAKADAKSRKSVIETTEAEMRELSQAVRDKAEYRDVDCQEVHDFKRGIVYFERLDTGECFGERAMTAEERQAPLDFAHEITTEEPTSPPDNEKNHRETEKVIGKRSRRGKAQADAEA